MSTIDQTKAKKIKYYSKENSKKFLRRYNSFIKNI